MARLPWQHIYLGSASFAFALALAIVGIAMNVQSLVWVIVLFGAAGILTIVSLLTFVLGARSWVKRVLEELERAQDAAVQAYQDYVGEWILYENKPLTTAPPEDRRLTMVRERTLTVLARLGPKGKREVLRFLQNQDLIKREGTVIPLNGADLSGASLPDMNLLFANLTAVNLKGADLSGAHLSTVMGVVSILRRPRSRTFILSILQGPQPLPG